MPPAPTPQLQERNRPGTVCLDQAVNVLRLPPVILVPVEQVVIPGVFSEDVDGAPRRVLRLSGVSGQFLYPDHGLPFQVE